jgi:hypothetical protein
MFPKIIDTSTGKENEILPPRPMAYIARLQGRVCTFLGNYLNKLVSGAGSGSSAPAPEIS